jgi:hypothetical protein
MRKTIVLFSLLCCVPGGYSQVNPYGLSLTPDGKIEWVLGEPNYNGNMDDPVDVRCGEESYRQDRRNVHYEFLTILEMPDQKWVDASNRDPSRQYDTTYSYPETGTAGFTGVSFEPGFAVVWYDTSAQTIASKDSEAEFRDDITGLNLNDSLAALLKLKIASHIHAFRGKYEPYEARHALYTELSCIDSVTDKEAVYDYLVDRLVFYSYQGNRLTSVMGYHWDSGVEFDSLQYDAAGNMVYFSREQIGSIRHAYSFEYNDNRQVSEITHQYSTAGNSDEDSYRQQDTEVIRFGYDDAGNVNSRSVLQEDGSWLMCRFEVN